MGERRSRAVEGRRLDPELEEDRRHGDSEWRRLRDGLRRETTMDRGARDAARRATAPALNWMPGSVAHLAYHLGAIRQIDRAARGPTAEDERRAEEC